MIFLCCYRFIEKFKCFLFVLIILSTLMAFSCSQDSSEAYDVVIRGGRIIDGIADTIKVADIGIRGERISFIGDLKTAHGKEVVQAKGKLVCPGFIDIHSHTDLELLMDPKAESKIRQGVTTELSGNCGSSVFPRKYSLSQFEKRFAEKHAIEMTWTDLNGYHSALRKRGMAVNHATLVGSGTLRRFILQGEGRSPAPDEMKRIKALVRHAMEQGAFGLSTGLEYAPDRFWKTSELIELCKVVAEYGGIYATHMRSEDTQLMEAVAEAIHIAEAAGLPLQISHFKVCGQDNYYKIPLAVNLIEKGLDRGIQISADRYPYLAYNTDLAIMYPAWALEGSRESFVQRLQDPKLRRRMKAETLEKAKGNNGWESMVLQDVDKEENKPLIGKTLLEVANLKEMDPYEFCCDLLISEGGELSIIGFGMDEKNTDNVLTQSFAMLGSDGVALAPTKRFQEMGTVHPRNYGTFPRFLQLFVREKKLLSWPQAIKKMTSMPAQKLGLKERGVLKKGAFADIVIFDPETVADRSTYLNPQQYPTGIETVIVNGQIVLNQGKHTGRLVGKVLKGPGFRQ